MIFTKVFGVITLVTLTLAHPPIDQHNQKKSYSIVTKHQVHHPVHHESEHHSSGHHELSPHHNHNEHNHNQHKAAPAPVPVKKPEAPKQHKAIVHAHHEQKHQPAPKHDQHHDQHHEQHDHHDQHDEHASYKYDYGVKDEHTGENKEVWENRDGDKVSGGYSLQEPDGRKRLVEYTSDKKHGFQADVKISEHPTGKHPAPAKHH